MSCSPLQLQDYFLGELSPAEAVQMETHVRSCGTCREEWERLQVTRAAMMSVREEEPLRRIAFVSDKVFTARWYQRFWSASPRWGFASAALLAGSILVHGFVQRPAQVVVPPAVAPVAVAAKLPQAEIDRAVAQAVARAIADQQQRTASLLDARTKEVARHYEGLRKEDLRSVLAALEQSEISQRQIALVRREMDDRGGQ